MNKPVKQYDGRIRAVKEPEGINIVLYDEMGDPIMDVKLPAESFYKFLMLDGTECKYVPIGIERIGAIEESKVIEMFLEYGPWEERETYIEKALKGCEVDGWTANRRDFQSPHTFVRHENGKELKGAWYNVKFVRYVKTLNEGEPVHG